MSTWTGRCFIAVAIAVPLFGFHVCTCFRPWSRAQHTFAARRSMLDPPYNPKSSGDAAEIVLALVPAFGRNTLQRFRPILGLAAALDLDGVAKAVRDHATCCQVARRLILLTCVCEIPNCRAIAL